MFILEFIEQINFKVIYINNKHFKKQPNVIFYFLITKNELATIRPFHFRFK